MLIIRKFKPCDFPWVIDIERKVFNEHDPYFYMQFYETCSDGFIVAEINKMVIGYIVGFQTKETTGRIFSFAVYPGYQNQGVGSNLLKEMINIFTRIRISEIVLEVRSSNIKAKRFYEKHGFYQIGIAEKYYNDSENALIMKLKMK